MSEYDFRKRICPKCYLIHTPVKETPFGPYIPIYCDDCNETKLVVFENWLIEKIRLLEGMLDLD